MKFSKRLERVLNEAVQAPGAKRYKIHHRNGKIIEADHVRKVISPHSNRIILVVGINPRLGQRRNFKHNSILHRLRDFTKIIDMADKPRVDFSTRSIIRPTGRGIAFGVIQLFEHVLFIGVNNIIKVEDSQKIEQTVAPTVGQEQPSQQSTGI